VHVESFEKKIRSYTRLSMSTKIPQYMAAARPILCYGPGEVASCRFIGENACGLVVGSQSKPELAAALRRLLEDQSLRKQLGENGWRVARQKFNAEDVRQRFRALVAEAAGQQGSRQTPLAHGR
jgi:glycosyltransferase involved in cell wall biosynthesis